MVEEDSRTQELTFLKAKLPHPHTNTHMPRDTQSLWEHLQTVKSRASTVIYNLLVIMLGSHTSFD